jgi:hypothetical protein
MTTLKEEQKKKIEIENKFIIKYSDSEAAKAFDMIVKKIKNKLMV